VLATGLAGGPGAVLALVWYGAGAALARRGGLIARAREITLFHLRDLMLPVLCLASLRTTRFEWRGNTMASGQLQDSQT
jgi:hypothetical protein